jgi:PAS domain S-box-containing protein
MPMPRVLTRLGADVERALTDVNVPAYVIDKDGILVWLNPSAQQLVGDARGKRFTDVVAPSDRPRAKRMFARKILGTVAATDSVGDVLRPDGTLATVELSSVPLLRDHQVIGVFGLVSRPPQKPSPIVSHPHLTPRQLEVLGMLAHGASRSGCISPARRSATTCGTSCASSAATRGSRRSPPRAQKARSWIDPGGSWRRPAERREHSRPARVIRHAGRWAPRASVVPGWAFTNVPSLPTPLRRARHALEP